MISSSQSTPPAARSRSWLRRIAWCEPFWIAALGALLLIPPRFFPSDWQPYSSSLRPAAVLLLALGLSIRKLAYQTITRRTPIDWPLLIILSWLAVNYWASADKVVSWEAISYVVFDVALYLALLNWPPAQRRPQLIAWPVLFIGIGLAATAPLYSNLISGKLFQVPGIDRFLQPFAAKLPGSVNTNEVGGLMALILPLAVAMVIRPDWSPRRWLSALVSLAALLMLVVLILAQSRGSYLATAIAIAVVFTLRWPKLLHALPVVLAIGAIVIVLIGPRVTLEALTSGQVQNGLNNREEIWSRAIYALSDFPFTGIGIGTWKQVSPVLYPYFSNSVIPDHAHNLVLQVGLDLGIPGLIAYVALFINTFVMLAKALQQRGYALDWVLAAGATGSFIALFINGLFDVPIWGRTACLPWLLVALSMQLGLRATFRLEPSSPQTVPQSSLEGALPQYKAS